MSEVTIEINEPVSKFVQTPILVNPGDSVKNAATLMTDRKSGIVVVVLKDVAQGIVTEWDIISRVVAKGKDPLRTTVGEIMSSPVVSVTPVTPVGEAIALMSRNKYRRLLVKEGTKLLGVITLSQVIGHSKQNTIILPLLEPASGARCPYCGSILKNRDELSAHIDNVHIREEMLRGAHGPSP